MQNTEENTQKNTLISRQEVLDAIGLQLDEKTGKISIKDLQTVHRYIQSASYLPSWEEVMLPIYPDTDRILREALDNAEHFIGDKQGEHSDALQNVFREALCEIDKKKNERYLSEISFSDPEAIVDAEHLQKSKKITYKGKEYYPGISLFVDERYYFRRNIEEGPWWVREGDVHYLLPHSLLTFFSYDPQNGFSWVHAEKTLFAKDEPLDIPRKPFDTTLVWKETSVVKAGMYPVVGDTEETQICYIPVEDARKILIENKDLFDKEFNRFVLVKNGGIRIYPDFPEGCSAGAVPCKSLADLMR